MTLFKQKNHQRIYEIATSVVLVFSLSIAMVTPRTVNAQAEDGSRHAAAILNIVMGTEAGSISVDLPVSEDREPVKTVVVRATAYNSLVGQTDGTPCITANGFDLCAFYEENGFGNTIAANFLPMGTQVRFPEIYGDKVFIVRDRMNARYGYGRIDIWMQDHGEAKIFGAKRMVMEVF